MEEEGEKESGEVERKRKSSSPLEGEVACDDLAETELDGLATELDLDCLRFP